MKNRRLLNECIQTIKIQDYDLVIKHNLEGISLDIYKKAPLNDILLIEKTWWFEDLSELAFNQEL
jgi:hypothetical protein